MKKICKNKYTIIILFIVLMIFSSIFSIMVYKHSNIKIDIQLSNQIWNSYDDSIEIIGNNMEKITEPNEDFDWWKLKEFDIEDDVYESSLNSLVAYVRMCYLEYTDDGTLYTNSNPIIKYRDKKNITKKELEKLNFEMVYHGCLKNFESFNTLLISNNEEEKNRLLKRTNKIFRIMPTDIFNNQNATYNELLLRKIIEVHYVEDMSDFLVEEYDRLK